VSRLLVLCAALLAAAALADAPTWRSEIAAVAYVASTNVADAAGRAALAGASRVGSAVAMRAYLRDGGPADPEAVRIAAAEEGYAELRARVFPEGVLSPVGETNELVFLGGEELAALAAKHRDGFAPLPLPVYVDHATDGPVVGAVLALDHEPGRGLFAVLRLEEALALDPVTNRWRFSAGTSGWSGVSVDGIRMYMPLRLREVSITPAPVFATDMVRWGAPPEEAPPPTPALLARERAGDGGAGETAEPDEGVARDLIEEE